MLIETRKTKSGPRFVVLKGGEIVGIFGDRRSAYRFIWKASAPKRQAVMAL